MKFWENNLKLLSEYDPESSLEVASHHIQRIFTKMELIQTLLKKMIKGIKKEEVSPEGA